jgi:ribonucleoside-triphosphate reductase
MEKKSKIIKIKKRDGRVVDFDKERIVNAIWKSAKAIGGKDRKLSEKIGDDVVGVLEKKYDGKPPTVEQVQDTVEKVLIEDGHTRTAKAYILYRKQHEDIRSISRAVESIDIVDRYLEKNDWKVKENSNMSYSLQGLNFYLSGIIVSNYWLNKIYPPAIRMAHKKGDIHLHDLDILGVYCVGWDLQDLLTVGFKGTSGKVASKPAKHLRVAIGQIVNYFYTLQGESAGAQAVSNFDTLLAPFVRYDNLDYKAVKQIMQEFLFNVNIPTRVGFQSPFTNISLDIKPPAYLKDTPVIIGGKPQKTTYGEYQKEMDMINRAFAEVMAEGDADGRLFTFPIPTYNITKDFDWDNPGYMPIWKMTAKYGIPYFSNFINSDMNPEDARSMCCRLRLDNRELIKRGGGLFGANPLTGSIGVVTINLPRIGYLSKDEKEFFSRLEEQMDLARDSLKIKRKVLENFTEKDFYPYSKFYLRNIKKRFGEYWKNHFNTIGLIGMNEASLNFLGKDKDIGTKEGHAFAMKVLNFMRDKLSEYQVKSGSIYNLEATPAEGTTYRLARLDKKKYPDIMTANEKSVKSDGAAPYYTNSSQLPVEKYTDNLLEALNLQDELQCMYTGGTVFHTFLGESFSDPSIVRDMVRKIAENMHMPYFTITPTFSVCPLHGYVTGEHFKCPLCEKEGKETECEVYSRIVGYLRPVKQWNEGKQAEFKERKTFDKGLKEMAKG